MNVEPEATCLGSALPNFVSNPPTRPAMSIVTGVPARVTMSIMSAMTALVSTKVVVEVLALTKNVAEKRRRRRKSLHKAYKRESPAM